MDDPEEIPMSNNSNVVEQHGCIVCGKVYNLLVVYAPDGRLVDCTVTSPGGRRVQDAHWPLVACDRHTQAEIETSLTNHYPGKAKEDLEDD
jgi:hypothetical protein